MIRTWQEVLWPLPTPVLGPLANRFLVRLWGIQQSGADEFHARAPAPTPARDDRPRRVSVIVPARNEAGNIADVFARTPEMGGGTELIFVEGHSTDDTYGAIERAIAAQPAASGQAPPADRQGQGRRRAARVRAARGDVLMILDADLTVPPEDLPRFYEALAVGQGRVRQRRAAGLPDGRARPCASSTCSATSSSAWRSRWLLGQPIKDTLCGTKVLRRDDYERDRGEPRLLRRLRSVRRFRPAVRRGQARAEDRRLPIRYRERTYGDTNIQRWRHGWLLLRMVVFAARRIKFV